MTGPALVSSLVALACVLLPLCAAQGSCVGRCGEPFTRGQICNCDYSCFVHGECCKDFDDVCTASDSCRGRCGEPFRRGRECECDSDCVRHNTCCPDYNAQCDAFSNLQAARSSKPNQPTDYTEQCMAACLAAQQSPDLMRNGAIINNFMAPSEAPSLPAAVPLPQDIYAPLTPSDLPGIGSNPSGFPLPQSGPAPGAGPLPGGEPSSGNPLTVPVQVSLSISKLGDGPSSGPASGSGIGSNPSGFPLPQSGPAPGAGPLPGGEPSSGNPLTVPVQVSLSISKLGDGPSSGPASGSGIGSNPSGFSPPQSGPAPAVGPLPGGEPSSGNPLTFPVQVSLSISKQGDGPSSGPASGSGGPSTLEDIAQATATSSPAGADANADRDLCSGLVIDGMASLFNGSIIVFRGHFFWLVNPKTKRVGPARSITEELGIPSPIDTAFTRCNCQGKTYIIKGDNYWSFENGVKEPGYPRSVSQDFGGLTGEITAALPVPATRKRLESVYFFKKGGTIQKFSYPSGSAPTCSGKRSKNPVNTKTRRAGQAEIQLSGEINIKLKMKGFPTPVTSAVSMPNPKKSDGFDYFVLSWPKVFNVKISGELPALTAPVSHSSQRNDISKWLNCA